MIQIGSLALENPVTIASGVWGAPSQLTKESCEGVGAIFSKTITLTPNEGNREPTLLPSPVATFNRIGLRNDGVASFLSTELRALEEFGPPVVVSISDPTGDSLVTLGMELASAGIHAVEINVGCPSVDYRYNSLEDALDKLLDVMGCVILKIPPISPLGLADWASLAEGTGCHALTVANSFPAIYIDEEEQVFRGGWSGKVIRPIALWCVAEMRKLTDLPIFGCGGISIALDVEEFRAVGATAVQIGSTMLQNPLAAAEMAQQVGRLDELLKT